MEPFGAVNSPCDLDGARDLVYASTRRCEFSHVGGVLAIGANPREMVTIDDVESQEADSLPVHSGSGRPNKLLDVRTTLHATLQSARASPRRGADGPRIVALEKVAFHE